MVLKGFDFFKSETGIRESFQQADAAGADHAAMVNYLILTDGVSAKTDTDSDNPTSDATFLAEESLRDYLDNIHEGPITEEALVEAFNHANRKVLQLFDEADAKVAISAMIIALAPSKSMTDGTTRGEDLLIAGVGDMKMYALRPEKTEEVFCDQPLPAGLTPSERAEKLTHAIGSAEKLSVSTLRKEQGLYQRYVAVTYGLNEQVSQDEIFSIGLRPHHPDTGIKSLLRGKTGENMLRACALTYEVEKDPLLHATAEPMTAAHGQGRTRTKRQRDRFIAMSTSIAATALVLGTAFQLLEDEKEVNPATADQETVKIETKKEPEPIIVQESPEESSWVVALKEQTRRQQEKIDQLSEDLRTKQQKIYELETLGSGGSSEQQMEMFDRLNSKILEREEQIMKLKEANLNFQSQLQSTRNRTDDLKTSLTKNEEELNTAKSRLKDYSQLQTQLSTLRNDFAAKDKTVQQLTAEKISLEAKLAAEERETEELEKLLGVVETQKGAKQAELDELKKENTRLTELTAGLEVLKNQYKEQADAIEKMRQNRETMIQQIIAAEKLTNELKKELAATGDAKNQAQADLKVSESRYQAYQSEMQREIAKLQAAQKSEIQNYEKNARALNDKLAMVDQQAQESAKATKEIEAKYAVKLRELEQTIARKEAQMETLTSAKSEASQLEKQLAAMTASFQKLEAEKQDIANQLAVAKQHAEEYEKGLASSRDTVMNYSQRYSDLEKQLTAKLDDLSQQYQELQTKYATMDRDRANQIDRLTMNYQQEKDRSASLERKVEEILAGAQNSIPTSQMEMEVAKANRRIHEIEQEYAEKMSMLAESVKAEQAKAAKMEQACAEAQQQTLALQEQLNGAVAQHEANTTMVASTAQQELKDQLQQIENDKNQAVARAENMENQLHEALSKLDELATMADHAEEAKRTSNQQFAELKSAYDEKMTKLADTQLALQNKYEGIIAELEQKLAMNSSEIELYKKNAQDSVQVAESNKYVQNELNSKYQEIKEANSNLLKEKSILQEKVGALEEFQEMYAKEHTARLDQEKQIEEIRGALVAQREQVAAIEKSRNQLVDELRKVKSDYTTLATQGNKSTAAESKPVQKQQAQVAQQRPQGQAAQQAVATTTAATATAAPAAAATAAPAAAAAKGPARPATVTTATNTSINATSKDASKDMAYADDAKLRSASFGGTSGAVATNGATRIHLVSRGETLSGISQRYYGTASRWKEIYEANKEDIGDINRVRVGTALVIP